MICLKAPLKQRNAHPGKSAHPINSCSPLTFTAWPFNQTKESAEFHPTSLIQAHWGIFIPFSSWKLDPQMSSAVHGLTQLLRLHRGGGGEPQV